MSRPAIFGVLCLVLLTGPPTSLVHAEDQASAVGSLLRDLKSSDFDKAYPAAERLGEYPAYRAQVAPALIEAITSREWSPCSGDVRDTIARSLGELNAREAVVPLLEVVKSGKAIEHECVE